MFPACCSSNDLFTLLNKPLKACEKFLCNLKRRLEMLTSLFLGSVLMLIVCVCVCSCGNSARTQSKIVRRENKNTASETVSIVTPLRFSISTWRLEFIKQSQQSKCSFQIHATTVDRFRQNLIMMGIYIFYPFFKIWITLPYMAL